MNWREETRKWDRHSIFNRFKGFVPPPTTPQIETEASVSYGYGTVMFFGLEDDYDFHQRRKEWAEKNGAEYIEDKQGAIWFREADEVLWEVTRP